MTPEQVIRRPIMLTEKANLLREKNNQVVFEVARDANKIQIKDAVQTLFKVKRRRREHAASCAAKTGAWGAATPRCRTGRRHRDPQRGRHDRLLRRDAERRAEPWASRTFKPTSPARRFYSVSDFKELTKDVEAAAKSLLEHQTRTGGRNNYGRITSPLPRRWPQAALPHHRLASATRSASRPTVATIEYDPNRTARIALLHYADGEKRYILAPDGLKVGDTIVSSRNADIKPGNSMPLRLHPARHDDPQHRAEEGQGRAARSLRRRRPPSLMAKDGDYAQVRLPSGEVRMVHLDCRATIGQVSNIDHANISLGKAGRSRWLGRRPHNRGVTMNPVDHPMGGGEGRTSGGRHPCSPWGQLSKGLKTRNNKRTDGMIVKRRGQKG